MLDFHGADVEDIGRLIQAGTICGFCNRYLSFSGLAIPPDI